MMESGKNEIKNVARMNQLMDGECLDDDGIGGTTVSHVAFQPNQRHFMVDGEQA